MTNMLCDCKTSYKQGALLRVQAAKFLKQQKVNNYGKFHKTIKDVCILPSLQVQWRAKNHSFQASKQSKLCVC